jgi:SAM-dependent methyltransferase
VPDVDEQALAQLKERTAESWGLGDYSRIARLILPVSRALVDACAISAGQEVLDVAAGNGNLTVLAGEEGASVVAADIAPAQVELGKARTHEEGLDVEWHVADAEDLPFEDDRFDCVASVFGAMFAPRPERVAREMFRVVRPGGTVGMANWGPYGSQGEMFECMSRYGPQLPEGVPNPRDWGIEQVVQERLGPHASSLQLERVSTHWEFDSLQQAMETFASAGPSVAARAAMSEEQLQSMGKEALALMERHNKASDGRVVVEPEYLQVVARKRG